MLIKIDPSAIENGMFVHGFEGSWFSHPFWRAQFVVTDAADLRAIRESRIAKVVIDTSKGSACPPPPAQGPATNDRATVAQRPGRSRTLAVLKQDLAARSVEQERSEKRRQTRLLIAKSVGATRELFGEARLGDVPLHGRAIAIVDDLTANIQANGSMFLEMTRLRDKDRYTYVHSVAVSALMVNLALEMGLTDEQVQNLGLAGLLHDIGKSTVDQSLLNKVSPLTDAEMAEIRRHVVNGHDLLAAMPDVPDEVFDVCLNHHERIDGSGYPNGVSATHISMAARMAAICDVFDALTSERPYKAAWSPMMAITEMAGQTNLFDRSVLFTFMKSIGVFPADTLVRMRSNQLALVLAPAKPKAPLTVRVFWSIADHGRIEPYDVVPSRAPMEDQIVSRENPKAWGMADWDGMRAWVLDRRRFGKRRAE